MGSLLHKRLLKSVLSPLRGSPDLQQINSLLDLFLSQSSALLKTSDDLASSTDAPQDLVQIQEERDAYLDVVDLIENSLRKIKSAISSSKEGRSQNGVNPGEVDDQKLDKWFVTCFEQIRSASGSLCW